MENTFKNRILPKTLEPKGDKGSPGNPGYPGNSAFITRFNDSLKVMKKYHNRFIIKPEDIEASFASYIRLIIIDTYLNKEYEFKLKIDSITNLTNDTDKLLKEIITNTRNQKINTIFDETEN